MSRQSAFFFKGILEKRIVMGCTEVQIRQYRTDDLEAISQLDKLCFSEEFRFDRESMRGFAEERGAITLIAEDASGELAGFVIVHIEKMATGRRAYVVTLDVAFKSRRIGVAGRLMQEIEHCAAVAGATRIELHVFIENEEAIRFYEGRGYRRLGMKAGFYGRGLDAWVYRKDLT
jgi:ribosomal-protein-alanine N-acetyltransferase